MLILQKSHGSGISAARVDRKDSPTINVDVESAGLFAEVLVADTLRKIAGGLKNR